MRALILFAVLFTAPLYSVRDANADDVGVVTAGSGSAAGSASANASVTVVVPDPNVDPLGDASAVYKLWKGGAITPALIVAVFAILTLVGKYWKSIPGKLGVYLSVAIAMVATLIATASQGQTPTLGMWFGAIAAGIALLQHPSAPDQAATKPA